jgi:hypothetical protein
MGEPNRPACVFERALLARCAACELAAKRLVGEGEAVACSSPVARAACVQLAGLLREKSAFALRLRQTAGVLPHAIIMKLHCGGLNGVKAVLDPEAPAPDVHRLVRLAMDRHGSLEALPYSEIVQGVAAWQGRRRKGGA